MNYATMYRQEGEAAQKETKQKLQAIKACNKEYQKLLLDQMRDQKIQRASKFKSMDSREKSLNAAQLRKLENDAVSQKVVAKLSPDKNARPMARNNIF
jgi:hypothetical protein